MEARTPGEGTNTADQPRGMLAATSHTGGRHCACSYHHHHPRRPGRRGTHRRADGQRGDERPHRDLKGSAAFPAVTGKAEFSVDDGIRQLEAEIENAKPLAGTNVRFRVDGALVGTAKVNSLGTARINKSGSVVPAVHTGSTIRVRRASNGALVAAGTFN